MAFTIWKNYESWENILHNGANGELSIKCTMESYSSKINEVEEKLNDVIKSIISKSNDTKNHVSQFEIWSLTDSGNVSLEKNKNYIKKKALKELILKVRKHKDIQTTLTSAVDLNESLRETLKEEMKKTREQLLETEKLMDPANAEN